MKPGKKPDPYAIEAGPAKPAPRDAPSPAPDARGAKPSPSVPRAAGAAEGVQAALFSSCLVEGVHVIAFSRSDVLDAAYIQRLGDDIYHHLKPVEAPRVVIDLENVEYMSSAALGMLVALKTVVDKKGGRICIANVRDQLMQVFKITNLHKHLGVREGLDSAVKSLR